jgi:hypothetical protein
MPEWTQTKSGKNVQRVDVAIPHKRLEVYNNDNNKWATRNEKGEDIVEHGSQKEAQDYAEKYSEKWQPDNLHENLPNTLGWAMIQYKTGPKGEKIALIAEAQSRWGQARRNAETLTIEKRNGKYYVDEKDSMGYAAGPYETEAQAKKEVEYIYNQRQPNHPLLAEYNRLILKAAIDQARKEGATHIMISDAETAMMTEGHDLGAGYTVYIPNTPENLKYAKQNWTYSGLEITPAEIGIKNETPETAKRIASNKGGRVELVKPPQEPGMRLNYDQILPDIASKITGDEGVRVSLGEHKNAYLPDSAPEAGADFPEGIKRDDLVFRNPDGTPKTDVSGLLFDIRQPAERLAKGEQMTLAGRKFSEPEVGELAGTKLSPRIEPALARYLEMKVDLFPDGGQAYYEAKMSGEPLTKVQPTLAAITDNKPVYHETSLQNAIEVYRGLKRETKGSWVRFFVSDNPDLALGQEGKGILFELDPNRVNGTRLNKPGTSELTGFEYLIDRSVRGSVISVTFKSNRQLEAFKQRFPNSLDYETQTEAERGIRVLAKQQQKESGIRFSTPELPVDPATGKPITRTDASKQGFFETLAAQFDQVRKYDSKVADAMSNAELQREMYEGQFLYKPLYELRRKFGNRASDRDYVRAFDYARAKFREDNVKDSDWTPLQREIALHWNSQVSRPVREVQQANGMKVETREGMKREAKLSPWYAADMLNEKMLDIFTRSTDSKTVEHYKKMWAEHVVEASKATPEAISYKDAYDEITNFITAIGQGGVHSAEFGALRKSKGFGLPEEMRERDIRKMMERYARRASRDLANFKLLESDPYVRSRLRLPNPETDVVDTSGEGLLEHEEVRDAMKFIRGNFEYVRSPRVMAVARAVTNGILGPISGLRDTATIPANVLPYVRSVEDGLDIIRSLGRVSEEWNNSLRVGARTGEHRLLAIDTVQGLDYLTNKFNLASEVLRKYQGRDALEQFNRVWSFAIGKNLAERAVVQKNKKFLDRFGALAFDEKTKSWNTDVLAKNFTDAVQGTYGGRGLPSKVVDGMAAPWFALARWSLEKSNVIFKDVIKPAYGPEKNFGPLITYALGAWMTGEAIESMVEMLNNDKKSPDAKWKELKAANADAEQYALRLANVMQLGSFAGMAGDVMKMGADLYSGETPQGFSVPMAQLFSEGIARNMSNFSRAVRDGADPIDALGILTMEFLKTQVQTVRVASNWMNEDEVERKNKFRDIRVWKKLTGEEVPSDFAKPNVAFRPEEREFKRAKTPEDAAAAFEDLLAQIQSRYADKPAEMKKALERLKRNSYQTFPAPEQDRAKAAEYYDYLVKAYGQAEADARLEDFMSQRAVNKAKTRFIPTQVQ